MINVMASERLMKTKRDGKETFILEIISFLSKNTVVDLAMELEKLAQGIRPTDRYIL